MAGTYDCPQTGTPCLPVEVLARTVEASERRLGDNDLRVIRIESKLDRIMWLAIGALGAFFLNVLLVAAQLYVMLTKP